MICSTCGEDHRVLADEEGFSARAPCACERDKPCSYTASQACGPVVQVVGEEQRLACRKHALQSLLDFESTPAPPPAPAPEPSPAPEPAARRRRTRDEIQAAEADRARIRCMSCEKVHRLDQRVLEGSSYLCPKCKGPSYVMLSDV